MQVRVVGEDGNPVEGARVGIGFPGVTVTSGSGFWERTDSAGLATASGEVPFGVMLTIQKKGYYESKVDRYHGNRDASKWSREVVLREIRNPIPMYAKKTSLGVKVDKEGKFLRELKYDFGSGDHLPPHGGGVKAHIVIEIRGERYNEFEYDYVFELDFPNDGDGIQPFYIDHEDSSFKSDYVAPKTGYQNNWTVKTVRRKGVSDQGTFDRSRNYYFRVNTVRGDSGEIVTANYGKIYGEFPFVTYYYNPTPNDRNVEFNVDSNLLTNLKYDKDVDQP